MEARLKCRRRSLVTAIFAAIMAFSAPVGASGVPVVDVAHLIRTVLGHYMNYSQNGLQYAKEVAQWKQMYDHYQQQLIRGGIYNAQTGAWTEFEKRDPDEGLEQSCGMSDALKQGTVAMRQFDVCQKIVRAQNAQYNEVIRVLETSRKRDQELQDIYRDRMSVGTDQGRLAANDNQLQAFEARVQMDLQYASQMLAAYDSYLANLKADQRRLAGQALWGEGAVGDVVRGAALKLALQTAGGRER